MNDAASSASGQPLPRSFYERGTVEVARGLLGQVLVHRTGSALLAGRIVETEAYLGRGDEAAHSFAGLTERTRVIFGPPGHAYVYFIYGVHHCLNVIAEPEGQPGCVLIRALEPVAGLEEMFRRRPGAKDLRGLASGPGKLTQAMGVTLAHYGSDVTRGPLVVCEGGSPSPVKIVTAARIGIRKSAHLPLRFYIEDNECVSVR